MLVLAFHPEKVVMGKESATKFGGPALFFLLPLYPLCRRNLSIHFMNN